MSFDHLDPENRRRLEARYGLTNKRRWPIPALVVALVGIPWLLWSAWNHSNPEIRSELVSFQPRGEKSIDITFIITRRDPAREVICSLIARDFDKNVVGQLDYPIPPSTSRSIKVTANIPTRLSPVNAAITGCEAK